MGVLIPFPGLFWLRLEHAEGQQMILGYNDKSKRIIMDFNRGETVGKDMGAVIARLLMQGWTEIERSPMNA